MEISLKCKNKFQSEKNLWIDYLTKCCGFSKVGVQSEVLKNRHSIFSTNPNQLQFKIDFSSFPEIRIKASNIFLTREMKEKIIGVWLEDLEERVFTWAKTQKSPPPVCVSYLVDQSFNGVSELISRLIFPLSCLILFNFLIYTFLCYFLLKGIISEIHFDDIAPPQYLSIDQLKPNIIGLYRSDQDLLKASFLCALIGGGWFLVVQQFLICCLFKFCSEFFKQVVILLIVFGLLEGLIYFDPRNFEWVFLFVPITFISYFIFGFFSRKFPIFAAKKPI